MIALVTGGNGFVGAAVVRALLRADIAVRVLLRPGSDRRNLAGLAVEVCEGDVRTPASLPAALLGCTHVYHLAALYSANPADGDLLYAVNVEGTRHLLQAAAAAGVERFVHTSTVGTIGRPPAADDLPTEDVAFNLEGSASHYVLSKWRGEQLALAAAAAGDAAVVVVHPTAPVGMGDWRPTATGGRILAYLRGQMPGYLAGGINFCDVDDIARGHLLAAAHGQIGRRYILGHPAGNLDLTGFLALLQAASGQPPPRPAQGWRARLIGLLRPVASPVTVPAAARPAALTCDPARALAELHWTPGPLLEAFQTAVAWYRASGMV
ncbi:MAG: NAD-dependent epimerase/dehydratase family protein [Anaerolineae bacterium]|nr:NAD-dependent epimerase/dehydratase family protein [Anaerolineae bacterium]